MLFTNAIYGQLVQVVGDHIVVIIIIIATDAAKTKDIDYSSADLYHFFIGTDNISRLKIVFLFIQKLISSAFPT